MEFKKAFCETNPLQKPTRAKTTRIDPQAIVVSEIDPDHI